MQKREMVIQVYYKDYRKGATSTVRFEKGSCRTPPVANVQRYCCSDDVLVKQYI